MARETVVSMTDDLDGKEIGDDGATMSFSFQDIDYEIDLSSRNAEKLTKALQPYIDAGRRIGGRRATTRRSSASPVNAPTEAVQLTAMREWARSNGYDVASRGRVSNVVQEAYHAVAG